ncbi:MAG TPA: dihydrouridine synthase [Bacteroidales bacterium]|nr:dihydrouridine synthase [Bacteroidales bacterium]
MQANFWNNLNKPHFSLAPMEDVTDTAFRQLVAELSDPEVLQVVYTEFMSTDGFMHEVGREHVAHRMLVSQTEREVLKRKGIKLVAQIWGTDPEKFAETARLLTENYDFDGIDLNMGCPVKKVVKQGACSALIGTPELAVEIIRATQSATYLPISVKTRIGLNRRVTEAWAENLLNCNLAALVVHGRLQKDMSEGLANWDEIAKAVRVRNKLGVQTPVIGNGDVKSYAHGLALSAETGVDGLMVGRGIFSNPWIFNKEITEYTPVHKIETMKRHIELFETFWGENRRFPVIQRFFKIYIAGFDGAAALRAKVMLAKSVPEVRKVLQSFGF